MNTNIMVVLKKGISLKRSIFSLPVDDIQPVERFQQFMFLTVTSSIYKHSS